MTSKPKRGFLLIFICTMVLFSFGTAALAEDEPNPEIQYPALYYGRVQTETGQPVTAGKVKAYVNGGLCGQLSFTGGQFGMPADDPYVSRLIVYHEQQDLTGKEVTFKVEIAGKEYAAKTSPASVIWESQTKQEVNLTIAIDSQTTLFTDLAGHWAEDTISQLTRQGILGGYEDRTFRPNNTITRAEYAAILCRALKLPVVDGKTLSGFADAGAIPGWARNVIAQTVDAGLISGYPEADGTKSFRPHKPVSRVEVAVILSRITLKKDVVPNNDQAQFIDQQQIPEWAREAVSVAAASGLVKGYPDGTFNPLKEVTRAEAAVMIARLLETM